MAGLWTTLWWCLVDTCICDKKRYVEDKPFQGRVPEDMLMEIFSRLPAECLDQCMLVCEDWNTLISTPYFSHNMFLPRASPTIILRHGSVYTNKGLCYIDDDHRGGLKYKQISLENPLDKSRDNCWSLIETYMTIQFSCCGLLFVDMPSSLGFRPLVINPITCKWVSFPPVSNENVTGTICGAFFHPTAREFRVLWVSSWITSSNNKISEVEFKMLRPRSEKHPQISWNALSKLQFQPMPDEPPVILHDCLHWMCYKYDSFRFQFIMVFSIIKEEFKLVPANVGVAPSQNAAKYMHIFDLDGYLSLWELTDVLNIWTLEEYYATWSWTKRYTIDVKLLHKRVKIRQVSVVGFINGALVINWQGKGIFVYHLQHKKIKKFIFGKFKDFIPYYRPTSVYIHTKSLISMTGFSGDEYKDFPFVM